MQFIHTTLDSALELLGEYLTFRGLSYDLVVVGGGALLLQNLIDRPTRDIDIVGLMAGEELVSSEPLPEPLLEAVSAIGRTLQLPSNWLNSGPADLLRLGLPEGFAARLVHRRYGGLTLRLLGRLDHVAIKLCAAADRLPPGGEFRPGKHFVDLRRLTPAEAELRWAACWCHTQSGGEVFEDNLRRILLQFNVVEEAHG